MRAHQQVQGLRSGVIARPLGACTGLRGGGVQEQLVVLEGVDQAGDVAQVCLGLLGSHCPGEAPTLGGGGGHVTPLIQVVGYKRC